MHPSFGMESRNRSNLWEEVRRGPSLDEVLAHTRKLGSYSRLIGGASYRPA